MAHDERETTNDKRLCERKAVYVHVPFCATRCDYCAFYSIAGAAPALRARYMERVCDEHRMMSGPPSSIYVGGGTPTLLDCDELSRLLGMLGSAPEFSIEANPDSLTPDKIDILARSGVNRVSLGIQSFVPAHRATIGRQGSLKELPDTLARLRAAGIKNIGMDLIYAIPGQSLKDWRADLMQAVEHDVQHISTYELTAEEGTRLTAARLPIIREESSVEMWELASELLRRHGLKRYEVSNFAQPGRECRYNMNIWHGGAYLGIGPSASSFDGHDRWTNPADIEAWLAGEPPDIDHIPPNRRAAEILTLGLRTTAGWTRDQFQTVTGTDYAQTHADILAEFTGLGLLLMTKNTVRPTERGLLYANARALSDTVAFDKARPVL